MVGGFFSYGSGGDDEDVKDVISMNMGDSV